MASVCQPTDSSNDLCSSLLPFMKLKKQMDLNTHSCHQTKQEVST
ncbi:rCG41960 [Rattus norvegicus]|uniref:RCG41960 n=1 Tax=Rattus norvegicus TaxID=10116 RepID=A6JUR4_RAT|nr:rCG41960 [Rattus norvegicus]